MSTKSITVAKKIMETVRKVGGEGFNDTNFRDVEELINTTIDQRN